FRTQATEAAVHVVGTVGVVADGSALRVVATQTVPGLIAPVVIALEPVSTVTAEGGVFDGPVVDPTGEPRPAEAESLPPESIPAPTPVMPPGVQDADAVARFVPFEPGALDGAIRRFVDSLK